MSQLIRPKVNGSGLVRRVCHVCRRPIDGDPVIITRQGRLIAYHADCHKEN